MEEGSPEKKRTSRSLEGASAVFLASGIGCPRMDRLGHLKLGIVLSG